MNSVIRVTSMVNRVKTAQPGKCLESILSLFEREEVRSSDIILLPSLALCSGGCGDLYRSKALLGSCRAELDNLSLACRDVSGIIIAGLVLNDGGNPVSVCAVLHQGQILGFIPAQDPPEPLDRGAVSDFLLPADTVFSVGDLSFTILPCDPLCLPMRAQAAAETGCGLIVVPSYSPVKAGETELIRAGAALVSRLTGCAVAVANGGLGDTTAPRLYRGFAGIWECGEELAFSAADYEEAHATCDLDTDIISALKKSHTARRAFYSTDVQDGKKGLLRPMRRGPYLPAEPAKAEAYLDELFRFQVRSLAGRMENTGIHKAVLGVSGGLDSTLALLVCAAAMDALELPREHILSVTMPGFGTSDRTYYNALNLIEGLGSASQDISIKAAVMQHFEDINQDPGKRDITYENAQARERAQILMDLANQQRALVVGTGDLSESALGWSTFGGDHIANYNVNICLTKTMIRRMVEYLAKTPQFAPVADTLRDILDTPVSPELLPPDEAGAVTQKTEEILGPYSLHDFFLYYLVRYGMRPSKIYYYACVAFSGECKPQFIKEKLALFLRRFFAGQFKRSCAPDCAVITEVSLSGAEYAIPADCSAAGFLEELGEAHF